MGGVKNAKKTMLVAVSIVALTAGGWSARVQAAAEENSVPGGTEEIVVTARKRTERLMDVPVSANVMTTQMLERYATSDMTALATQLPQISIDSTNAGPGAVITVRGIGAGSTDTGIDQEVTVNIDGIPISRGRVTKDAMFDLGSVEVLKGPQSLFFGKNSPAGVITLNGTAPGDKFEGYVQTGYETTGQEYYGEAAVTVPMSEVLSARFAIHGSDMMGGYVKNAGGPITDPALLEPGLTSAGLTLPGSPHGDYPGSSILAGRGTIQFRPNPDFDATLSFMGADYRDNGPNGTSVAWSCGPGQTQTLTLNILTGKYLPDPYVPCNGQQLQIRANSYGTAPQAVAQTYRYVHSNVPFNHVPTYLVGLTMNYRPTDELKFTSVTGYYKYDAEYFSENTYSGSSIAPGYQSDFYRQWSQELRAETAFDFPVNFTAGFFYSGSDRVYKDEALIAYIGPDPVTGQWSMYQNDDKYRDDTYSGFVEASWKILANLELAAGARYTRETSAGNLDEVYIRLLSGPKGPVIGSFTDRNVSPQATLTWHPDENVLLYVAYKSGFKAGGFSSPAILPANATAQNQSFHQETVRGFEGGLKFNLADPKLTGDVTAYHYGFYGLQLTAFDAADTSYFTQNAGSASQTGFEANLQYRPIPPLQLHTSVGYNSACYTSFPGSQCWAFQSPAQGCAGAVATGNPLGPYKGGTQNLTGQPLSRAPEWSVLAGATYTRPLNDRIELSLSGDLRYSSGYFLEPNNSPYAYQPGYVTVDASVRLTMDSWEFAVIGRNLGNTYYATIGLDKPLGPVGQTDAFLGDPRTVRLQVTKRF